MSKNNFKDFSVKLKRIFFSSRSNLLITIGTLGLLVSLVWSLVVMNAKEKSKDEDNGNLQKISNDDPRATQGVSQVEEYLQKKINYENIKVDLKSPQDINKTVLLTDTKIDSIDQEFFGRQLYTDAQSKANTVIAVFDNLEGAQDYDFDIENWPEGMVALLTRNSEDKILEFKYLINGKVQIIKYENIR